MALVAAALVMSTTPGTAGADPAEPAAEHVVLIGFDGFDPDYRGRVPTPNIDALIARGAGGVTQGVMLPITNPSFTSLTTGAWPDRSGNRAYWWNQVTNRYEGQSRRNDVTSIADAVVAAGGTVGSAQYFILQGNGTDYGRPGAVYTQPGGTCSRKFDDAIAMLRRQPVDSAGTSVPVAEIPTLLAVYCGDLDEIGHDEGAESPRLDDAMRDLDAQVGRLVAAIEEAGISESTSIILTGDHGMTSYTQSYFLPLYQAIEAAGYTPQALFAAGQSVAPTTDVVMISAGRSMTLYLTGSRAGDTAALAEIRSLIEAQPGTGRILDRDQQRELHVHPDYGDLVVESQPGWGASILPPSGPQGDHGSGDETDAVFVMAGAGVARTPGEVVVRHIDVAPTIAHLLGLDPLPDADGEALTRLLVQPEPETTTTTGSSTTGSSTTSTSVAPDQTVGPGTTAAPITDPPHGPSPTAPRRPGGSPTSDVPAAPPAEPRQARPTYVG